MLNNTTDQRIPRGLLSTAIRITVSTIDRAKKEFLKYLSRYNRSKQELQKFESHLLLLMSIVVFLLLYPF